VRQTRAEVLHWSPADYLTDYKTTRLDTYEHGAYMLLLWHMWQESDDQCSFPLDSRALGAIWGTAPEEAERLVEQVLLAPGVALLQRTGGKRNPRLVSKRLREQRARFDASRDTARKAGKESGRVRRERANDRSTTVEGPSTDPEPTVVTYLGSHGLPEARKTPKTSRPLEPPISTNDISIAYCTYAEKLGRLTLTKKQERDVSKWVTDYGLDATTTGIGYAARDGFVDDPARVCGQIKALVAKPKEADCGS
jgi:uncharacterized protein YdaU (DUF1376 family)